MSFNAKVLDELRALVLEEGERVLNIISQAGGIDDFASYKERVGQLYAYRRVLDLFDEAINNVEKME